MEKPEVHYVDVDNDYRRKGVASILYDIAVDLVHENGYKLFQSTTQTPEAEAFWSNRKGVIKNGENERSVMIRELESPSNKNKKRLKP